MGAWCTARRLTSKHLCRCTWFKGEKMLANTEKPIQITRSEVLHWDGRLDNRDDLLPQLAESLRGDTSNAAIARAAYDRWGTDGFVHLIGDWSLVIRDRVNGTTVLASDFAGVRPLYYQV